MPAEFDPYAEEYDRILGASLGIATDVDRFAAYKIQEVAHRLKGHVVKRVLDFGCGVGRGLPFFAAAFPDAELWGFDPSHESVAAARKRESRALVTSEWSEIPNGQFDCVVAANVFHHIPEETREAEMLRCATALARTGSLFVFEHNPFNPVTRRVFDRCPFDRDAKMLRRSELVNLGVIVGLGVRRAAYTLFLPYSSKSAMSFQRALGWLPLGAQYYVQFVR